MHAIRDLSIMVATLALWHEDAALRGTAGMVTITTAVATGIMTAVCGFIVHEWGHFLGALSCRSDVRMPNTPFSLFLFNFDPKTNRPAQFIAMSSGGFLASGVMVGFFLLALPLDALSGRVAMGFVGTGVVATFVLEVPPFVRVLRGAPIPRGAASPPPAGPDGPAAV
jgi:membrane-associated protease RseP (regulator of RpoE activity)